MPPKPPLRVPLKPKVSSKPVFTSLPPRIASKAAPNASRSQSQARTASPPPRDSHFFHIVTRTGGTALISLCAMLYFRDHFFTLDTVRGSSMAPTLSPTAHETGQNDRILIRRYNKSHEIRRGDVVTFWKPHRPEEISIKRVIAVEGDTVYPKRGFALDPDMAGQKRFGFMDGLSTMGNHEGEPVEELGKVVVPHGHIWVEGDNWRKSYDSCDFGPISKGLIDGKAMKILRGWFNWIEVGDKREKGAGSTVVKGTSRLPEAFTT